MWETNMISRRGFIQGSVLLGSGAILGCETLTNSSLKIGFLMAEGGLGDQSFNDMTYQGLQNLQQTYSQSITVLPQEALEATPAGRKKALQKLLSQKPNLIVVNGFEYEDLIKQTAPKRPQTYFLYNDQVIEGFPNVAYTTYGQHEGSFLVGALSAYMTETKKLGVIGGVDIDVIKAFIQGYREGIQYVSPQTTMLEEAFVSLAPDFSGFNAPDQGKALALQLFESGVDIIFAVAGFTNNGIIEAAREVDKFVIGVDADQDHLAPGHVLTSMMKRLDIVTEKEVEKFIRGEFKPGGTSYGLKEEGVSLSPMRFTRDLIPETILTKIEEIQNQIISGDIQVTNLLQG